MSDVGSSAGIFSYCTDSEKVRISYCYDKSDNFISGSAVTMQRCYGQLESMDPNAGDYAYDFAVETSFVDYDFTNVWMIRDGRPVLRALQ